jgi:hypothetical protein
MCHFFTNGANKMFIYYCLQNGQSQSARGEANLGDGAFCPVRVTKKFRRKEMAWDQPGRYVCSQDSTRSKGLSMAVLRDSCSGNLLRLSRSERELHEISYGHDPGVPKLP